MVLLIIQFNLFRHAKRLSTVIKVCSHNKTEKKQKQKEKKLPTVNSKSTLQNLKKTKKLKKT